MNLSILGVKVNAILNQLRLDHSDLKDVDSNGKETHNLLNFLEQLGYLTSSQASSLRCDVMKAISGNALEQEALGELYLSGIFPLNTQDYRKIS